MRIAAWYVVVLCVLFVAQPAAAQLTASDAPEGPPPPAITTDGTPLYTVDDLNFDCRKCINYANGIECVYCDGLLTGVATTLGMFENRKSFCPPLTMDTVMVRNFFRKWYISESKNRPIIVTWPAVKGVVESLKSNFPCKQGQ